MGAAAVWLLLAGCSSGNSTQGESSTGTGGSAAASSSSGDAGIGGRGAALLESYCDTVVPAFCEAYFACCPDPMDQMTHGGSVEGCKKAHGDHGTRCVFPWVIEPLEASLEAGITILDQAEIDACVAHFHAMTAGGAACTESVDQDLRDCLSAFRGTLAPGDHCTFNLAASQCEGGMCVYPENICVPYTKTGEPCPYVNPSCNCDPGCGWSRSNFCNKSPAPDGPLVCVHPVGIGEPCTVDYECKSINCDTMTGKCALPTKTLICTPY